MPGNGNHPGDRQIGSRIKDEVRSALQLLFRQVGQHAVDTRIATNFTAYVTDMPCESVSVSLVQADFAVSSDPIRMLHERKPAVHRPNMLNVAALAPQFPCRFDPVPCHEPMFTDMALRVNRTPLDSMQQSRSHAWPFSPLHGHVRAWPTPRMAKPATAAKPPGHFQTRSLCLSNERLTHPQVRHATKFYALPIKKSPLPPHRFSNALRTQFRQALADKAQTKTANIQLRLIYERMDMALYAAIQQDEHGNLLCTPKPELLGRNPMTTAAQSPSKQRSEPGNTYLLFGIRLDTREDIRVLVPANTIQREAPP